MQAECLPRWNRACSLKHVMYGIFFFDMCLDWIKNMIPLTPGPHIYTFHSREIGRSIISHLSLHIEPSSQCYAAPKYTIRLKFSNFFIHHYFQNQMFENFAYAFNMSSDAQIHGSRRVCVLFSRPRSATLRLKNHANHVPRIPRASHVINVCLVCLVKVS